ncbi:hypothetical protein QR680_018142 [Steinernema hermaphroditum]|uniref:Uncharacterized protein n=1 Tax=Steinernema hermaphroditum TaxID=289476 RepID=A0AA39LQM0_9BILA|nr:hypothetical protein QR680_018142 [Steinernema hermaphroditum]
MSPSEPPKSAEGAMTAVRENFINLPPMEIPRPKCQGMQFITTRGRQGFYQSIRRTGAQYGLQIKPMGPRRAALPDQSFWSRPETVKEEEPETASLPSPTTPRDSGHSSDSDSRRSSSVSYFSSKESSPQPNSFRFSQPIMEEPEFPEPEPDYDDPTPAAPVCTPTSPPPPAPPLPSFQKNRMALAKKLSAGRL